MSALDAVLAAAYLPAELMAAPDPEDVKPGWLGLGVVVAMAVLLYFILRSFVKQLKKVDFDEDAPRGREQADPHPRDNSDPRPRDPEDE